MNRHHLAVAALLLAAGLPSAPARADILFYGVAGTNLVRFNMTTQTVSTVAPLTSGGPLTAMEDCDFDASGALWGIRQGSSGFPPTSFCQAYRIDTTSGNSTPQGNYGSSVQLQSLALRASTALFYSADSGSGATAGRLVTTDPAAGSVSSVGPDNLSPSRVDALAFSPGGTLFGIYNAGSSPFGSLGYRLVSFNLATGNATVIGPIAETTRVFASLRFDSAGVAYTVDANSGDVFTVNTSSGVGTLLFAGGAVAAGTRGLAFIPAPGCAALLAAGGVLAARRRRPSSR